MKAAAPTAVPEDAIPSRRRDRRAVGVVVAAGLVAVWVVFLYALSWHIQVGNSDNANAVLAGEAMARGNVFLRGWTLPGDTYWPIDLPVFSLFTAVASGPAAIHGVPVLLAVAVILVGARLAGHGWVGAGVVFLLLGLPHPFLTDFFLEGPNHVGTTLLCLLAFLLLSGAPTARRWGLGAALLAVAVLGDPYALAIGVVPVAAAGIFAAVQRRRWEPALACGAVALAAVAGAHLARLGLDLIEAHRLAPPLRLPPSSYRLVNLRVLPGLLGSLLGAARRSELTGLFRAVHFVGLTAVATAVVATAALALIGVFRRPHTDETTSSRWDPGRLWLDGVLLLGFGGGLAAYVLLSYDVAGARYLLPSLAFGAVLAGRRAGEAAARLPRRAALVATAALLAVGSLYLAASVSGFRRPRSPDPARDLIAWLTANDLTDGYGQYWSASIMTVRSEGAVRIRPVTTVDGRLRPNVYYASLGWFRADPLKPRRFVVYMPGTPPLDGVDDHSTGAIFGPPARSAQVGPYRVLIWDQDLTGRLGPPSS